MEFKLKRVDRKSKFRYDAQQLTTNDQTIDPTSFNSDWKINWLRVDAVATAFLLIDSDDILIMSFGSIFHPFPSY